MTAIHRASTWPLTPGPTSRVDTTIDDSLVLALLPRSLFNEPRVREAYSRAIFEHWWSSQRNRTSETMVIDWPPSIEIHPLQERSNSLQVGPRTQYTGSSRSAMETSPNSPLPESSQPEQSETLQHVGGSFLAVPHTGRAAGCRSTVPDGMSTPSNQSILSLSSEFSYRQSPQNQAATPAYVSWPHPNIDDSIVAHAPLVSQGNDQSSVGHFSSYAIPIQRDQARQAPDILIAPEAAANELQENRKRARSSSSEIGIENRNPPQNDLCSVCKRRKVEHEEPTPTYENSEDTDGRPTQGHDI